MATTLAVHAATLTGAPPHGGTRALAPAAAPPGINPPPSAAATVVVQRRRLLRRLAGLAPEVSLVVLTAPIGYGKTTLAGQWVESSGLPHAWLRLHAGHRDPARLARDIAAALRQLDLPAPTRKRLAAPVEQSQAVSELAAAIASLDEPILIVLDDLQQARTRPSLDVIVGLATQLPAGCRLVVASDNRPRLPARQLEAGRTVVLGPGDLALSTTEVAALLQAVGLNLPAVAVQELARRTEGWASGVQLAADALRRRADPAKAVFTLTGEDQVFADFLQDELLPGYSAETVRFLLRTAVLDELSGPLSDAALDTVGSEAWLTKVTALGMPITEVEAGGGGWYRYRRLFGEMLRAELRRREPGEEQRVLRRAAAWYEGQGMPEQAIACALGGDDRVAAARVLLTNQQELNSRGRLRELRRWLDDLGEELFADYPPLAPTAAWVYALSGDGSRARQALQIAERARYDGALPDGSTSLASAVARARALLTPDGVDRMLTDAQIAFQLEPPGSPWHTVAATLLGVAQRLTGATEEAACSFEQAARFGRAEQRLGVCLALAQRALLAADQEDWPIAEACASESWQLMQDNNFARSAAAVATCVARGRVALHSGAQDRARNAAHRALSIWRTSTMAGVPVFAAQLALELGRLLLALDEPAEAEMLAVEAGRHAAVLPTAALLPLWVDQLLEEVRRTQERVPTDSRVALTRAESRVLSLLPTYLSLGQMADELVVSRNTVKSQVAAVYRKLGAANRAEAVLRARESGLLMGNGKHPA